MYGKKLIFKNCRISKREKQIVAYTNYSKKSCPFGAQVPIVNLYSSQANMPRLKNKKINLR